MKLGLEVFPNFFPCVYYEWTNRCIFPQELIDIMCVRYTGLESQPQYIKDAEQYTEVDNMTDAVY